MALIIYSSSDIKENPYRDFVDQKLINQSVPCTFFDIEIDRLKSKKVLTPGAIFRSFDPSMNADFCSDKWVCFPEFPFNLGLSFPFPPLFTDFFSSTKLCYSQTMPMVWRTLFVIQNLIDSHSLDIGVPELAHSYNLRSHGSSYFLFQVKSGQQHLVLQTTKNDPNWKRKIFFVDRESIPNGNLLPSSWVRKGREQYLCFYTCNHLILLLFSCSDFL